MTDEAGLVVVGGGLSAVKTIERLRFAGYSDSITLLTDESVAPYDRPPLSKEFLTGDIDEAGLALLRPGSERELDVDVRLNSRVVRLDRAQKSVTLADGTTVPYGRLLIATGAKARRLDGMNPSPRIHYIRTIGDAVALREALADAERVLVIGSGFIGLEVASSVRSMGKAVRVVAADRGPMIGAVGPVLSAWIARLHERSGVVVDSGLTIDSVEEGPTGATVRTSDGNVHEVDVAVVGVGVTRALEWIEKSGLATDNGLLCDVDGRSSDPDVFGAGDIVCRHSPSGREEIQHWTAAMDSSMRVAHALMDLAPPPPELSAYFWSDQHGCRLQFTGSAGMGSTIAVVHGDLDAYEFAAEVVTDGVVTGAFASNSPKQFMRSLQRLHQQQRDAASVSSSESERPVV